MRLLILGSILALSTGCIIIHDEARVGGGDRARGCPADLDCDGLDDAEEVRTGTDPSNADCDGDGLDDGAEAAAGMDPLNPDTDDDGLDDATEVNGSTDPLNPDTDDDGLLDGEEVDIGTDPVESDTDGDGLLDGDEVSQCGSDPRSSTQMMTVFMMARKLRLERICLPGH